MSEEKMSEITRERLREKWEIQNGDAVIPWSLLTEEEKKTAKPINNEPGTEKAS